MVKVAIVGGGQAGAELAVQLRQLDSGCAINLLCAEKYLPYQRPPLSKDFLSGDINEERLLLRPGTTYEEARINVRCGVEVKSIDRDAKTILLDSGEVEAYDKLVLATGGRPRRLITPNLSGKKPPANIHYIRNVDDVLRLKPQFRSGARLVVIGGGYIGLEAAAVAIKTGLDVTVLESAPRLLQRVAGEEISAFIAREHRAAGVDVVTGAAVHDIVLSLDSKHAVSVAWSDENGRDVETPVELIIVGIGLEPNIELAENAGLKVNRGIVVDKLTRTVDPNIHAIGDCACSYSELCDDYVRIESVSNAVDQARMAARVLLDLEPPPKTVPWFWSDQYDLKLQSAGLVFDRTDYVVRGDVEERSFCVFYLDKDRVLAADVVNKPADFMGVKELLKLGVVLDRTVLADRATPLIKAVRAAAPESPQS